MKARIKYSKGEEVKYVGHLDTMRTFVRCIKRSIIPVKYSNGFNPRMQLSFALPLGVGVTSSCEYFDLDIQSEMNKEMFLGELNSVLPIGFRALDVIFLSDEEGRKSLMSLVKEAKYEISIKVDDEYNIEKIKELFEQDEIILIKETNGKKGKTQEINLKNYILDIDYNFEERNNVKLIVHSTAGSSNNLSPNYIIQAVEKYVGAIDDYEVHRLELYLL